MIGSKKIKKIKNTYRIEPVTTETLGLIDRVFYYG